MKNRSLMVLVFACGVWASSNAGVPLPVAGPSAQEDHWVIADFELEQFGTAGWSHMYGAGLVEIFWGMDDSGESEGVLWLEIDSGLEQKAAFGKDNIDLMWTESDTGVTAISFDVYVPGDCPEDAIVKVWAQDRINWGWNDFKYYIGRDDANGVPYEEWKTVTFDIPAVMGGGFDPAQGMKAGIEFYIEETWDGFIFIDNITLWGVAPPAVELAPPTDVAVTPQADAGAYGQTAYYNRVTWADIEKNAGETYNIYAAHAPITDVTADGVIKLDSQIPRGVEFYHHQPYSAGGAEKTWYYAVTTVGVDAGRLVETDMTDGSSAGPVVHNSTIAAVIPLVENFGFSADGSLSEFEVFADHAIRPVRAGGPAADAWTETSEDLNFSMWLVMDAENFYAGARVVDDDPGHGMYAWEGDGVDIFAGFYDVAGLDELHSLGSVYDSKHADYRISFAVNAGSGEHLQKNGSEPWDIHNAEYRIEKDDQSYTVEAKIPFKSIKPVYVDEFVPQKGMYIPLKIDVNDNDGDTDPFYSGSYRTLTLHWGGIDNDQNWKRPSTWGWALVGGETAVSGHNVHRPSHTRLTQNYPNPFNPVTTIEYELADDVHVVIDVFDITGRKMATLVDEPQKSGQHVIDWYAGACPSGIYFYRLKAGALTKTRQMLFLK